MIKQFLGRVISYFSPVCFFKIAYFHNREKKLDLKCPSDLSAIWIKKVLEGEIKKYAYLADKYAVRAYVKSRVGDSNLSKLIGVWEDPALIDFTKLPDKFALKLNYGAGMNLICTDKQKLDKQDAIQKLKEWLSKSSHYSYSESHYNLIPRKIICEEFIVDGNGNFPIDYKFLCIKGEPFCILACSDRDTGYAKYTMYSPTWEWLPDYQKEQVDQQKEVNMPLNLDEMLLIARKLSFGLDLVRVDLYDTGDKVLFGEMTLTPAGCIFHRWTQKALDEAARYYFTH